MIQVSEIMVAAATTAVTIDDIPHVILEGHTLARSTHPIVTGNPGLWKPLDITYDVDEPEPKAPARASAAAKKQPAPGP